MNGLCCIAPRKLAYQKIKKPEWSAGNTIVNIKKIGICGTDLQAFAGNQPYFSYPRTLGHELAAEIVESTSSDFHMGELVTIIPYFSCGHCVACRNGRPNCCVSLQVAGVHIDGGMVEYMSVPNAALVHAGGLSPEELALVEPLAIGAHAVRRAEISKNDFVLIAGAGPIGLAVAAFAGLAGANIIIMDIDSGRLRFCEKELGIKHIIHAGQKLVLEELRRITGGDMPALVLDATGNRQAINGLFQYIAHGGKYVLVGLQKDEICFSHPEFHKREATLMSSRNATREDFSQVINAIKQKWINPLRYITHHIPFVDAKDKFESLLDPQNGVIKAIIDMDMKS